MHKLINAQINTMITKNIIDSIKQTINIADVIGESIKLQSVGINMRGVCPFHNEKTPSFYVETMQGFFKCFGCGIGGDVINFVMQYNNISFIDAVKILAQRANISIQEQKIDQRLVVLKNLNTQFKFSIKNNQQAIDFLHNRGIDNDAIEKFSIGFMDNSQEINNIISANLAILQKIKFIGNNKYCAMRNRIIFPIANHLGQVIAFNARSLNEKSNPPKYIHSHNSDIFNKSNILYNLHRVGQRHEIIITEGVTDVLAFNQMGVDAVAILGSSISDEMLQNIMKKKQEVIVCLDGDQSGKNATMRIAKQSIMLWQKSWIIKIIAMPNGLDPDNVISKSSNIMRTLINNAVNPLQYIINNLATKYNVLDYQERGTLQNNITSIINSNPDIEIRKMMQSQMYHIINNIKNDRYTYIANNRQHNVQNNGQYIAKQNNKQNNIDKSKFAFNRSINNNSPVLSESNLQKNKYSSLDHYECAMMICPMLNIDLYNAVCEKLCDIDTTYIKYEQVSAIYDLIQEGINIDERVLCTMLSNYLENPQKILQHLRLFETNLLSDDINLAIQQWYKYLRITKLMHSEQLVKQLKIIYKKTNDPNLVKKIRDIHLECKNMQDDIIKYQK